MSVYFTHSLSWCELQPSVAHAIPGGFHLGTLPPAGAGESAGLDEGTEEDGTGRLGATFATGELLTGVVFAAMETVLIIFKKCNKVKTAEVEQSTSSR